MTLDVQFYPRPSRPRSPRDSPQAGPLTLLLLMDTPYHLRRYISLFRWIRRHRVILLSIIITTFNAIIISPLTHNYYYYCYYNDY